MENNLDLKNGKDTKRDIFDKIMSLPVLRIFEPFYKKYKDILLYIFFGGLTTIVSFVTFWVCCDFFEIHELVSNTISWVASVTFAFFTNRIWVFSAPTKTWGGSMRLSINEETTDEDIDYVISVVPDVVKKLRAMSPLWERICKEEGIQ